MNTRVVNIRKEPYDVYIGRRGHGQDGKWGNPFSQGTREENIENFRQWIVTQPNLLMSVHELRGQRLGCFCKPQACHGDVLASLADLPIIFPVGAIVEDVEQYGLAKVIQLRLDNTNRLWYHLRSVKSFDGEHRMGWTDSLHVQTPSIRRHDPELDYMWDQRE